MTLGPGGEPRAVPILGRPRRERLGGERAETSFRRGSGQRYPSRGGTPKPDLDVRRPLALVSLSAGPSQAPAPPSTRLLSNMRTQDITTN